MAAKARIWTWVVLAGIAVCLGGILFFHATPEGMLTVSRDSGIDVISTDAKTGATATRDRRTGKIGLVGLDDANHEAVHPHIAPVPSWVPIYPKVRSVAAGAEGSLILRTEDPIATVVTFYEAALGRQGIVLSRSGSPQGVVLAGSHRDARLALTVTGCAAGAVLEISMSKANAK